MPEKQEQAEAAKPADDQAPEQPALLPLDAFRRRNELEGEKDAELDRSVENLIGKLPPELQKLFLVDSKGGEKIPVLDLREILLEIEARIEKGNDEGEYSFLKQKGHFTNLVPDKIEAEVRAVEETMERTVRNLTRALGGRGVGIQSAVESDQVRREEAAEAHKNNSLAAALTAIFDDKWNGHPKVNVKDNKGQNTFGFTFSVPGVAKEAEANS